MCISCYEEFGSPEELHDKTDKCVNLINKIYEYHSAGSNLHIVIDDWNLDDSDIEYCKKQSIGNIKCGKLFDLEMEVCDILLSMNESQRATVLAVQEGFISA